MNKQPGFSLIEILITLGIIAFLISVTIPRMGSYIARAQRTEANLILSDLHAAEQAYHIEHGTYTTNLNELGWQPHGSDKNASNTSASHIYTYGFGGNGMQENINFVIGSSQTPGSTLGNCYADANQFIARAALTKDGNTQKLRIDQSGKITTEN